VEDDVTLGYVSLEAARAIYGVDIQTSPEEMRLESIRQCVRRPRL
jgi:hypothetical protein